MDMDEEKDICVSTKRSAYNISLKKNFVFIKCHPLLKAVSRDPSFSLAFSN